MKEAKKIIVSGRVQKVFFRDTTKAVANQLGVNGFIKNLPDGNVYIEAEAPSIIMNEFIEWCKIGPDNAHVTDIVIEDIEIQHFQNFNILKK